MARREAAAEEERALRTGLLAHREGGAHAGPTGSLNGAVGVPSYPSAGLELADSVEADRVASGSPSDGGLRASGGDRSAVRGVVVVSPTEAASINVTGGGSGSRTASVTDSPSRRPFVPKPGDLLGSRLKYYHKLGKLAAAGDRTSGGESAAPRQGVPSVGLHPFLAPPPHVLPPNRT